jgi:EAL domain-containing protein (putative c-di-GMP-specific phosphodiesterase class I)/GGDEF domain-containing protein
MAKLNSQKLIKHAEIISILIVTLFLVIYLITIIAAYPAFYTKMAEREAKINFDDYMNQVSQNVEEHYKRLDVVVEKLKYADTNNQIKNVFSEYDSDDTVGTLRYIYNDKAYTYGAKGIEEYHNLNEKVIDLAKINETGCTAVYFDDDIKSNCIAFFVPVRGSLLIDGLISIVRAEDIISVGDTLQETTSVTAVVDAQGNFLSCISNSHFSYDLGSNCLDLVETITGNKDDVDTLMKMLKETGLMAAEISILDESYTLVSKPIGAFNDHIYLFTLSESNRLVPIEFDYAGHLTFVLIITIIALIIDVSFAIRFRKRVDDAVSSVNLQDAIVECPNIEGFKKNATKLLHHKSLNYAIVVFSLKRFHFIEDQFGADASVSLLKYMKEILVALCHENETFGYFGDGKFLLLMDFNQENIFRNRLSVFEGIINKYETLKENRVKMQLAAGVYLVKDNPNKTVADMIDCATIVCGDTQNSTNLTYAIYTDSVRDKINQNEHLEARMEAALSGNEFRLFLQPKYNVERDEVDSAEALVRWFDYQKGDYRYPAEFIGLFESNGFIVEMDHFIYLEVLKYLNESKARGNKVVPISVNVSRVTAANADFVNFYVGNKRRYSIDDGLITLEFTESYATEDYHKLSEIVTALHEGGIRCSIDDFGVGYSSFHILKNLEMDELKLDRLFLSDGVDHARDDKIIKTIAELAKSCGMVLVMEGVENKEMYDRVVKMGVEVIQGYYYAKAISLEEFKIFINSNTSIRYKSTVK